MNYVVKEIFYSVQGEGANVGRPAVFCRFAGCNLWSGREVDRPFAICRFCDTDFLGTSGQGGGTFENARELAKESARYWPFESPNRFIVLTGGEPLLQVNSELLDELHAQSFEVAVETNGTIRLPNAIDWICVSPKAGTRLQVTTGNELKLVYPQVGSDPSTFEDLAFDHFFLQPLDSADRADNTEAALAYCLRNPRWRLSIQTHKVLGVR